MPQVANRSEQIPAASDSNAPSDITVIASRARDEPSDDRIANSCDRLTDRVSMTWAALTHAMTTTRLTAPRASSIQPRMRWTELSRNVVTSGRQSGVPRMRWTSSATADVVTPGRILAIIPTRQGVFGEARGGVRGTQRSASEY